LILLLMFLRAVYDFWNPNYGASFWTMPFSPHWVIGGTALTGIVSLIVGVILMILTWIFMPAFFRGETLPKRTAEQMENYVVPEELRD
jgi:hypothetical protein